MAKVLIIEDDPIIGEMTALYLSEESYTVLRVDCAERGVEELGRFHPDVILLDLILPDSSGPQVCAKIRSHTAAPIIVVSMMTKVADRIQALMAGADDFLVKPYSMQELLARIQAVLRRTNAHTAQPSTQPSTQSSTQPSTQTTGQQGNNKPHLQQEPTGTYAAPAIQQLPLSGIALDHQRRVLVKSGESIEMTFSEYEIMKYFFSYPNKVFTRDELINCVRGIDSYVNERSVDVHVTNLRKKLEDNPKEPRHIKTVWGIGYKFVL